MNARERVLTEHMHSLGLLEVPHVMPVWQLATASPIRADGENENKMAAGRADATLSVGAGSAKIEGGMLGVVPAVELAVL
jgi:hypothetical protein